MSRRVSLAKVLRGASTMERVAVTGRLRNFAFVKRITTSKTSSLSLETVIAEDEQKSVVGEGPGWDEYYGQSCGQWRTKKLGFCQKNHRKQGHQDSAERNPHLGVLFVVLRDVFSLFLFSFFLFGNGFVDLLEGNFGGYKRGS
ncbi:hypothetical protein ACOSQ2_022171 [Xanthoceras sorbifolium]